MSEKSKSQTDFAAEHYGKMINELEAENKALKETAEIFNIESELRADKITEQAMEISALKESRNELLEEYKKHRWDACRLGVNEELIQKAEALKEKGAK